MVKVRPPPRSEKREWRPLASFHHQWGRGPPLAHNAPQLSAGHIPVTHQDHGGVVAAAAHPPRSRLPYLTESRATAWIAAGGNVHTGEDELGAVLQGRFRGQQVRRVRIPHLVHSQVSVYNQGQPSLTWFTGCSGCLKAVIACKTQWPTVSRSRRFLQRHHRHTPHLQEQFEFRPL